MIMGIRPLMRVKGLKALLSDILRLHRQQIGMRFLGDLSNKNWFPAVKFMLRTDVTYCERIFKASLSSIHLLKTSYESTTEEFLFYRVSVFI